MQKIHRIVSNSHLPLILCLIFAGTVPVCVSAQDSIPKFLLIKLTRDQSATMCASETFTQCMEFTAKTCLQLSETAIEKCLAPLPDEIDPQTLENKTLEACPQQIYQDAGYSEEKAKECFDKAMDAAEG